MEVSWDWILGPLSPVQVYRWGPSFAHWWPCKALCEELPLPFHLTVWEGPEEGLSYDLLGGVVLQGWVQTGRTALCARGLLTVARRRLTCLCSHFICQSWLRGAVQVQGWRNVPSVRWEEGKALETGVSWQRLPEDHRADGKTECGGGYWSTVTSRMWQDKGLGPRIVCLQSPYS